MTAYFSAPLLVFPTVLMLKEVAFIAMMKHGKDDVLDDKCSAWTHQKSCCQMFVYLDNEEQQDKLFAFLKTVLHRTPTQLSFTDKVLFICGVLFPEAIIYGLSMQGNLSLQEAEQVFLSGPTYHQSEVEEFSRRIKKDLKKEGRLFSWRK